MEAVDFSKRLLALLKSELDADVPSTETDLFDEGYVDSLGLVDLIMAIEREFGISVPLAEIDIDEFRTIEQITSFLASRSAA